MSEPHNQSASVLGIPGLRGTDHVGLTVPNLQEATDFFVNVIGCEQFYDVGPFGADDDWMETHLNVHPRAIVRKLRFFRCRNGSNYEVFEYVSPDQRTQMPKNSDVGGHHLALYVDDIGAAIAHLKANGIRVLGEPTVRSAGPSSGQTWVYFLSPWGLQFELVSFPNGKAYERETSRRLWDTRFPDR
ncbi:VOC family protein [Variovorax ureilyticus]|uniref:VOC family protein n=1 Tax=Variovorax ureilyticus TaxID=1836198 RepID=A0ABU8VPK1_9BURK